MHHHHHYTVAPGEGAEEGAEHVEDVEEIFADGEAASLPPSVSASPRLPASDDG